MEMRTFCYSPLPRVDVLPMVLPIFIWFISTVAMTMGEFSCYSYAQYQCQREMTNLILIEQRRREYSRQLICSNFTELTKCIKGNLVKCISVERKNDSNLFHKDIIRHYNSSPYNCPVFEPPNFSTDTSGDQSAPAILWTTVLTVFIGCENWDIF